MVAGQPQVCSVGFSVALLFLAFYAQLIILKSMEKDIAFARRQVEGFEFVAWKFFKPLVYQRSAFSGNNRFVPVTLYCSIMRSVSEYLCQMLRSSLPHYLSDELERIQRCAMLSRPKI